jgi:hypothetical protein
LAERRPVCRRQRAHNYIHPLEHGQDVEADDLSEPSLYAISRHGRMRVARHDEPGPCLPFPRRGISNIKVCRANALALYADSLKVTFQRQPAGARKATFRRQRILTAI